MNSLLVAERLEIKGVVQGVGFRPFLFGLAQKYDFKGEVSNTSDGVLLDIEGSRENIDRLCEDIFEKSPLLASVTHIRRQDMEIKGHTSFKIVKSKASDTRATLISPDVAICKDCLAEMQNPHDRRFEYPFINCTNCGPRYTIIEDVPYDRPKTSMKQFTMCSRCQDEYDNPLDRRFHAQPNACPQCGPHVWLVNNRGERIISDPDPVALAADVLSQGKIVAVKGLGGFHLAVDASNQEAVSMLRQRKKRPHKPFALMAASAEVLKDHVSISDMELNALESYHRPIVILKKRTAKSSVNRLAQDISPLNPYFGVMLPYTPLHYLLLAKGPDILVMTSGNRSGEPLSIKNSDAVDAFANIADYFLLHNRDIYFRADDSIMHIQNGTERFIRRSRGYAPLPIVLDRKLPPILGCGGGLKSTVCLTRGNQAFLSQHIGDLENEKSFRFYQKSIAHLEQILDIHPEIIVHDMHPGYMSTAYAAGQAKEFQCLGVQHHHAHAVSCMAENNLDQEVIAITLDGTGYGTDGKIWGGEILTCTHAAFTRKAHLKYLPMPGSETAILEPWRMATSCLFDAFGKEYSELDIEFTAQMEHEKTDFLCQMIEKKINSPMTSSCGRLFDAVASLLCIRHEISFESQAAMELEAIADGRVSDTGYGFQIMTDDVGEDGWILDIKDGIRDLVQDLKQGISKETVSRKFHRTMIDVFVTAAAGISQKTGIRLVVLSGGVFHNTLILNGIIQGLEQNNLTVYTHSKVPAGDGGISLGQVMIAAASIRNKE